MKEFKPHFLKDINFEQETEKLIPGINAPQINSDISIENNL